MRVVPRPAPPQMGGGSGGLAAFDLGGNQLDLGPDRVHGVLVLLGAPNEVRQHQLDRTIGDVFVHIVSGLIA